MVGPDVSMRQSANRRQSRSVDKFKIEFANLQYRRGSCSLSSTWVALGASQQVALLPRAPGDSDRTASAPVISISVRRTVSRVVVPRAGGGLPPAQTGEQQVQRGLTRKGLRARAGLRTLSILRGLRGAVVWSSLIQGIQARQWWPVEQLLAR
ncbi:hypothetical protein [Mycolicibacterium frederiksbergense]|uniref:hypothetical protein n=1 Tax=Mycolicibacterium frederiksbergense TaxID=117567 RepID=UPI00399BFAEF